MSWKLSRYQAGDIVEVLSKEEILASLDESGCLEGMPFMPEMLKFCGQQFQVRAVAHKTCETSKKTWQGRKLETTTHLGNLRCDGSSHGGCEAGCSLFWKDQWLKPVDKQITNLSNKSLYKAPTMNAEQLIELQTKISEEAYYTCQATKLFDATQPLAWWDLRQYIFDYTTGNHSLRRVLRVTALASLRHFIAFFKRGYKINDWIHTLLTNRPSPSLFGKIKPGEKTPEYHLNLQPGELVRIKSKEEIEKTINDKGLNRGLSFDCEEMAPYCGKTFRVQKSITKILDESTGKMLHMKQPCIVLEGVVCNAEYAHCRLNCPRAIPCFWRELWLERVNNQ